VGNLSIPHELNVPQQRVFNSDLPKWRSNVSQRPTLAEKSFRVLAVLVFGGLSVLADHYLKFARATDETLRSGGFSHNSLLYSSARQVAVGDEIAAGEITSYLQRIGYAESKRNEPGSYWQTSDSLEITPRTNPTSPAKIGFQGTHISRIELLRERSNHLDYLLEPEPITNLFDGHREKRRVVPFDRIPKVMIDAVLAAEDKRFFSHSGFDATRIVRALWVDLRQRRKSQGASTLTQQLARTLWLGPDRGWQRKIPEALIALHLERSLTKKQIFEDYANAIYLGHSGSFSIHGFAEASQMYFGKDLRDISLPEAALLAGLIQAPYTRNPFRYPDRAQARRDLVLNAMRNESFITENQYRAALATPVHVVRGETESTEAPYFVDLVNETLQTRFQNYDFQNTAFRVYTTLDLDLQRDAVEAVRLGIQETDKQWRRRSKKYGTSEMPQAQIALVALEAQTGAVKALIGGRSYGSSQLDRAVARRQPGSSFKPFVYIAAMTSSSGVESTVLTPASTVEDEPAAFYFHGKSYEPSNHQQEYWGPVTLRFALAHSLNIPAVKVAEMAGYDKVARIAHAAGLNGIKATPSMALGSYEVTPLDIAGAYTVFANSGRWLKPSVLWSIRGSDSAPMFEWHPQPQAAVDPRAAYLVLNMMEDVLRSGTGAGVRARGFGLPAAGKTGTSHDGWFAGFTSKLICVVWVGFDDNRDIQLTGAQTALPIWTEFMKRAHQHSQYRNVHQFERPSGLVTADIDAETGGLATPNCPKVRNEVFIAGTQPLEPCAAHGRVSGIAVSRVRAGP
jgi:penicillin-binding protein 1B